MGSNHDASYDDRHSGLHRQVIAERRRDLDSDSDSGDQWDVVQQRLRDRLKGNN
jgi:hypothetical protein